MAGFAIHEIFIVLFQHIAFKQEELIYYPVNLIKGDGKK